MDLRSLLSTIFPIRSFSSSNIDRLNSGRFNCCSFSCDANCILITFFIILSKVETKLCRSRVSRPFRSSSWLYCLVLYPLVLNPFLILYNLLLGHLFNFIRFGVTDSNHHVVSNHHHFINDSHCLVMASPPCCILQGVFERTKDLKNKKMILSNSKIQNIG